MNRQNYRAAFDAVDFSPDFEERTLQKLAAMRHASEKEQNKMSMNRTKKITLLAAAAVALLAVTVSAAVLWLTVYGANYPSNLLFSAYPRPGCGGTERSNVGGGLPERSRRDPQ